MAEKTIMKILHVTKKNLGKYSGEIAALFNQYREFYHDIPDTEGAENYILERMNNQESTIYLAIVDDDVTERAVGFVQLYTSFSSVAMQKISILNDLYVDENYRRLGVARELMLHVQEYVFKDPNIARISLKTSSGNQQAQKLYESLGYEREEGWQHYVLGRPLPDLNGTKNMTK